LATRRIGESADILAEFVRPFAVPRKRRRGFVIKGQAFFQTLVNKALKIGFLA
jgi:hypothetical protein